MPATSRPRKWFGEASAHAVNWDVTGLSYYSFWHGSMQAMTNTVKELAAQYAKPVVIVETAYPFTLLENDEEQNSIHASSQLTPAIRPRRPGRQIIYGRSCRRRAWAERWASSTGSRLGRQSKAMAGTPPIPTRAASGKTRLYLTSSAKPCRPCRYSRHKSDLWQGETRCFILTFRFAAT